MFTISIIFIDFKSTSEIYFLGFLERPKFQVIIFFVTNHGRGSLEGTFTTNVSLVPPLLTKTTCTEEKLKRFTASSYSYKYYIYY